ncbi:MAG: NAD(P)-dependent alcohol dehydrogenase [Pseudomonadales bacterium]|nr:NAD(P)-dependent alcohol dehydrogenase [Pseudomonadales bacterium]MCP5319552.1 NAD(P)-dependent alcohol dehydrogenase [Pseudomonadales bacterium]MCP5337519.1 NAD(P)-dependent alcohol dehydrogenase [Pseudomonadales bacterium]
MKHYHYTSTAPLEGLPGAVFGLALRESPVPTPGPGEVLVRMRASALNFADLVFLHGSVPQVDGVVPLLDGAGEIATVGDGVDGWRSGDKVIVHPHRKWIAGEPCPEHYGEVLGSLVDGTLAEYALMPAEALVAMPAHLSFAEAAALPCAGLSAWNSILGGPPARRPCLPGETVLVQGTGGVSLFALQFAKLAGCRVIATTSTAAKAELLQRMGADAVVNYRENPQWSDAVLAATNGRGVDLVVEVGGPNTLAQSIRSVRVGGRIAMIGIVGGLGSIDYLHLLPVIERALTLFANAMGSRADLSAMLRAVAQHRLRPVIDREFPFAQATQAVQHFAARGHIGKVVITHD